jgi:hypothetical protein
MLSIPIRKKKRNNMKIIRSNIGIEVGAHKREMISNTNLLLPL